MDALPIVAACLLASSGACAAEWFRLWRGWNPRVGRHYGTASSIAVLIVLSQFAANALVPDLLGTLVSWSLFESAVVAFVVGPLLHGLTWLLIVTAWDALHTASLSGRRSPRG